MIGRQPESDCGANGGGENENAPVSEIDEGILRGVIGSGCWTRTNDPLINSYLRA